MGPPGKLERDACRMAADLPWQISCDLVLKWAEVMAAVRRTGHRIETADAWIGATRASNTTPAPPPRLSHFDDFWQIGRTIFVCLQQQSSEKGLKMAL